MPDARDAILGRLRAAAPGHVAAPPEDFATLTDKGWSAEERLARLRRAMEAVHAEFLDARGGDWVGPVHAWLAGQNVATLLHGPASETGRKLAAAWPAASPGLVAYDRSMGEWKAELFAGIGAGITGTRGGIAATGTLILWPSIDEPRTLSLVPPIHVAVLDVNRLYDTMLVAMREQGWARAMPTNIVLVSGPSKTADIEQTLAYGVHGPKRLLVVLTDR